MSRATPQVQLPGADGRSQDFLRMMLFLRHYEERALELRAERRIVGPVHPYIGQEAIATGVCAALDDRDMIVTNYRGHGHALARGVDPLRLTAELFGRRTGLCGGRAAGHFSDSDRGVLAASGIVAGGVPLAAGAAMGAQLTGAGAVVVCFLGDGALGAGVVHEVLNIAAVQALPLVLVCEHNRYQSATRTEDVVPDLDLVRIAAGHRMSAYAVDGNDVHAVADAADAAVRRARGGKPTFLQMDTYLTTFHIQFDQPSREHRPPAELAEWLAHDPIDLLWRRMLAAGVDADLRARLHEQARHTVDDAVAWAHAAPLPEPADLFTHSDATRDATGDATGAAR